MNERNFGLTHLTERIEATRHTRSNPWPLALTLSAIIWVVAYFVLRIVGWL